MQLARVAEIDCVFLGQVSNACQDVACADHGGAQTALACDDEDPFRQ